MNRKDATQELPDEMRKEDAAKYVGCSVRSIENYAKQGRISTRYEKSKTRPIALYNREDLDRLKDELQSTLHKPTVVKSEGQGSESTALIPKSTQSEMLTALAQLFATVKADVGDKQEEPTILEIAQMPLLKLKEAQKYSNLSRASLLAAIEAKQLKATKIGRGWKIRRDALENYIKKNY